MDQTILQDIIAEIKSVMWFSLIADEATDILSTEQMSVMIQWVDNKYLIHEHTLGLKELVNTKAVTIHHEIKDILVRCLLPVF